jgi:hypothetical protein
MIGKDVTQNFHQGADTSAEAQRQARPSDRARMSRAIYDQVKHRGESGVTCHEIELILGLQHQSASARITELVRDGWIKDSGQRRYTRGNRKARVYVVA